MNENIVKLTSVNKENKFILINNLKIDLPNYVLNSLSKYQFLLDEDQIYLQRKCNLCKKAITVQQVINNSYINVEKLNIKFIGKKSGFHNTCYDCEEMLLPKGISNVSGNNTFSITTLTQLNTRVDRDLKKYYQHLALNNESTLSEEIKNALLFYKMHIERGK